MVVRALVVGCLMTLAVSAWAEVNRGGDTDGWQCQLDPDADHWWLRLHDSLSQPGCFSGQQPWPQGRLKELFMALKVAFYDSVQQGHVSASQKIAVRLVALGQALGTESKESLEPFIATVLNVEPELWHELDPQHQLVVLELQQHHLPLKPLLVQELVHKLDGAIERGDGQVVHYIVHWLHLGLKGYRNTIWNDQRQGRYLELARQQPHFQAVVFGGEFAQAAYHRGDYQRSAEFFLKVLALAQRLLDSSLCRSEGLQCGGGGEPGVRSIQHQVQGWLDYLLREHYLHLELDSLVQQLEDPRQREDWAKMVLWRALLRRDLSSKLSIFSSDIGLEDLRFFESVAELGDMGGTTFLSRSCSYQDCSLGRWLEHWAQLLYTTPWDRYHQVRVQMNHLYWNWLQAGVQMSLTTWPARLWNVVYFQPPPAQNQTNASHSRLGIQQLGHFHKFPQATPNYRPPFGGRQAFHGAAAYTSGRYFVYSDVER